VHLLCAVDDLPGERPLSGVANEDHARILTPEVMPQMVADPSAGAHPIRP
jgi:hypothetical protein